MEKTIVRRVSAALIALLVAFSMLYVNTGSASAVDKWETYIDKYYYVGQSGYNIDVGGWDSSTEETQWANITSVKSSKPSIVKIKKYSWTNEDGSVENNFTMSFKKVGSSKLTINFTKPDGTTGTITKTVKVKKYPNQIKSLKVAGKTVKTSKGAKRYEYEIYKYKKTSIKVKMALKKGWKVSGVYVHAYNSKTGKYKEIKVKKSAVTKGTAIKFPKGYDSLNINIDMKKGTQIISYYVGASRNKY